MKAHTTGRNKASPEFGVDMLGLMFEFEKVDLPWRDPESRREVQPLCDELLAWPGELTDSVMSMWFMAHNARRFQRPADGQWTDPDVPAYLYGQREIVDLNTGQRMRGPSPW